MTDGKLNQLIQQAVDGNLPAVERKRLDKLMEHHPRLKHQFNKIKKVTEILEKVGSVEPPPHLRTGILRQMNYEKYRPIKFQQTGFQSWLDWVFKPKPGVALAFCSGFLVGGILLLALLTVWFSRDPVSNMNLTGTIGMGAAQPVIEILYDFHLSTARIKVNRYDQLVWLEINFSDDQDMEIKLDYDGTIITADPSLLLRSERIVLKASDNQLIIKSREGGHLAVFFIKLKPAATVIDITVFNGQEKGRVEKIQLK
jgi:hypothetical protein